MFEIEKKPFLVIKTLTFQSPKNRIFPMGLTHGFGQKKIFFLYLFSVKIRLEIIFNNVLDRKETFFWPQKIQYFKVFKIAFFQRG